MKKNIKFGKTLWDGYDILFKIARSNNKYRYATLTTDLCIYPVSSVVVVRVIDGFIYFFKSSSYEEVVRIVNKYKFCDNIEIYDLTVRPIKLEKYTVSYKHKVGIVLLVNKQLLKHQINKIMNVLSERAENEYIYIYRVNREIDKLKDLVKFSYFESERKRRIQNKIRRKFIHNFSSLYGKSKSESINVFKRVVKKLYFEN